MILAQPQSKQQLKSYMIFNEISSRSVSEEELATFTLDLAAKFHKKYWEIKRGCRCLNYLNNDVKEMFDFDDSCFICLTVYLELSSACNRNYNFTTGTGRRQEIYGCQV